MNVIVYRNKAGANARPLSNLNSQFAEEEKL